MSEIQPVVTRYKNTIWKARKERTTYSPYKEKAEMVQKRHHLQTDKRKKPTKKRVAIVAPACMYGHPYSKSMDQPGKVANRARGQLNRENEHFL